MQGTSVLMLAGKVDTRERVHAMLNDLGCTVRCAATGEEGLSLFTRSAFDVALSDVNLPGLDGVEVLSRMHAADPVLAPMVMTSRRDPETAVRAMERGIKGYLLKPFDQSQLANSLLRALVERQQTVEMRRMMGDLLRVRADLAERIGEQERFLHHLVKAAPFAIISTDPCGRILTFNQMAERLYGYSSAEMAGQPAALLWGDTTTAAGSVPSAGASKARHCRKDGSSIAVLVQRIEILGERHRAVAQLHIIEDLTEREQMEGQLLYAEKLSLLGQLAPRIAHEFKTPLQIISGHAELAREWLKGQKGEEARASVEQILPAATRMLGLVRQMTELGRPKEPRLASLDLGQEMDQALVSLQGLGAVKHCQVIRQYADDLPAVQADPEQIGQVFRNLIINAAQAMETRSERVLTLTVQPAAEGLRVEVSVADTGYGIEPDHLERVFQPFFTTKLEGTGLGLPIVRTILDRQDGTIKVESQVEVGTRFVLSFPALPRTVAGGSVPPEIPAAA